MMRDEPAASPPARDPTARGAERHRAGYVDDRRAQKADWRPETAPVRRDPPIRRRNTLARRVARDVAAGVMSIVAIAFTVGRVSPIYTGSPFVARRLENRVPIVRAVLPHDSTAIERAVNTPQFLADRHAFAADLTRTGRMSPARADSLAYYAVREAYTRGIPPAVIFGVMLTENALFVSNAMSNVGAVGLMQVYPKIWLKVLGERFGTDLQNDSTNLKYGTFILSQYINPKGNTPTVRDIQRGLLRYNGCVHGTNTPNCHSYPSKVQQYVQKQAASLCGDRSFIDCIAKPFVAGLLGEKKVE